VKFHSIVLLVALLLAPAVADAVPPQKPKRPMLLQPLQDELAGRGEIGKDAQKALKVGERCMNDDKRWDQALKDGLPVNDIYEMLQGAVFCWQNAEKKATKAGEVAKPATDYFAARARYIESFRTYIWGIEAKLIGDRLSTCKRLKTATTEAGTANTTADGLVEKFTTEDGKILAGATIRSAVDLGTTIADEYKRQKCE